MDSSVEVPLCFAFLRKLRAKVAQSSVLELERLNATHPRFIPENLMTTYSAADTSVDQLKTRIQNHQARV